MQEVQIENQIINAAIDFILSHLEVSICVDDVAKVCGFSKFYLNRLFKEQTGESIYEFIKRLKVEQSAFRLKVEKERSITEIGSDYGYSPSNYATVFSKHFQKNPALFRKEIVEKSVFHPFYHGVKNKLETYEEVCSHITIETFLIFLCFTKGVRATITILHLTGACSPSATKILSRTKRFFWNGLLTILQLQKARRACTTSALL